METLRLVLAEDHTIVREGVRALLAALYPEFQVVGEAEDGVEAVRVTDMLKPDLVLIDLTMPLLSGLDAIRQIRQRAPDTKILALTVHRAEEHVFAALQAGANGYVLKDATSAELLMAIRSVAQGKRFLSPGISDRVIDGYLGGKRTTQATTFDTLTQREREILKMVAEGFRNRDIAESLFISPKTVEKHRANLMHKLKLRSVPALTAYAIEKGLVSP